MIPSTDLFKLIKSLTKSEKRYFKMFANFSGDRKQNNSTILFDAIDEQEVYNEDELKERFKDETFTKQFAVAKNYLQQTIIRSLTAYHNDSSASLQLLEMLKAVEVLYDKGHFGYCRKIINRAKELCESHEKAVHLDRFLEWESRILMRQSAFGEVGKIIDAQMENINNYSLTLDYKDKAFKMYSVTASIGVATKEDEFELLNLKLSEINLKEPVDTAGKYYRHSIYNLYNCAIDNREKVLEYAKNIISLLESKPFFLKENPAAYISALNNYCSGLLRHGETEEALATIKKMRSLTANVEFENKQVEIAPLYALSYDVELSIYIVSGKIEHALALDEVIKDFLSNFENDIQRNTQFEICFNMALANFYVKNYDHALQWLYKIMNNYDLEFREDLYLASRLLVLIIHYEMNNIVLLYNLISSTHRYLKNKKMLHGIEHALLHFLKSTAITDDQKVIEKLLELKKLIEEDETSNSQSKILHNIDLLAWINAKFTNKQMPELVAMRYYNFCKTERERLAV
jgi:hypothetical protein